MSIVSPSAMIFWPIFAAYVSCERGVGDPDDPAWIMFRRGGRAPVDLRRI